jgi:hypothetical protein
VYFWYTPPTTECRLKSHSKIRVALFDSNIQFSKKTTPMKKFLLILISLLFISTAALLGCPTEADDDDSAVADDDDSAVADDDDDSAAVDDDDSAE